MVSKHIFPVNSFFQWILFAGPIAGIGINNEQTGQQSPRPNGADIFYNYMLDKLHIMSDCGKCHREK